MKWRQTGLVVAAALIVVVVLYLARGALFPFIISLVLAELLYPLVVFLEERMPGHERMPGLTRIISILLIYAAFLLVAAGVLYVTIPPLFEEAQELLQALPAVYEHARSTVEGWSREFSERVPIEVRRQIEDIVESGGVVLADGARGILLRTFSGVSNAVTLVIGLAIVPFFLFYILKDRGEVVGGIYPMLSPRGRLHTRNVFFIINRVIGSYVRAQLMSATIVGALVFVGLSVLGIEFAATLGLVAGLFGLIPIIGPLLGAVPGLLVTLANSPEQIVWVALMYVAVQLIENYLISPRIHGRAVRLNPAIIMAVLVVSSEIAGLWGVIVGVPLTAAARDVFVYFHKQWENGGTPPAAGMEEPAPQEGEGAS